MCKLRKKGNFLLVLQVERRSTRLEKKLIYKRCRAKLCCKSCCGRRVSSGGTFGIVALINGDSQSWRNSSSGCDGGLVEEAVCKGGFGKSVLRTYLGTAGPVGKVSSTAGGVGKCAPVATSDRGGSGSGSGTGRLRLISGLLVPPPPPHGGGTCCTARSGGFILRMPPPPPTMPAGLARPSLTTNAIGGPSARRFSTTVDGVTATLAVVVALALVVVAVATVDAFVTTAAEAVALAIVVVVVVIMVAAAEAAAGATVAVVAVEAETAVVVIAEADADAVTTVAAVAVVVVVFEELSSIFGILNPFKLLLKSKPSAPGKTDGSSATPADGPTVDNFDLLAAVFDAAANAPDLGPRCLDFSIELWRLIFRACIFCFNSSNLLAANRSPADAGDETRTRPDGAPVSA
ncbi:hypothetical protein T4D_11263 [Trichinella pseudospiralis]|uniref:Uncharacterized protein n=1 Tax=Trichinella pseudospiralis TaxID=6337 RepID=A0A0V1G0V5_TRIPS|nr:hypothetical protein T4D_11263 [Trichinella pseudospiralis]